MNTPNPLIPQGSLHQQQSRGNSTVRIAVFAVVALHAVFFAGLLMQGCGPGGEKPDGSLSSSSKTNTLGELDADYYKVFNELPTVAADFPPVTNETPSPAPISPKTEAPAVNATPPIQTVPSSPPEEVPLAQPTEYVVIRGDSLYKIAKEQKVTINAIVQANPNIDPSLIRPGQKIIIPAPAPASSRGTAFKEPAGANRGTNLYTVQAGDTLIRIALLQKSSVAAIKSANNLRTDRILAGWKLVIPPVASSSASNAPTQGGGNRL